jgi:hypothetical protein
MTFGLLTAKGGSWTGLIVGVSQKPSLRDSSGLLVCSLYRCCCRLSCFLRVPVLSSSKALNANHWGCCWPAARFK